MKCTFSVRTFLAKIQRLNSSVYDKRHGLIQSELGNKMLVSRANITGLIGRLEKEDLVVRRNDPSDKRVYRVYLTNRACALIQSFLPIHNNFRQKIMSILDNHEKEVLITLLRKLNKGLNSL